MQKKTNEKKEVFPWYEKSNKLRRGRITTTKILYLLLQELESMDAHQNITISINF